MAASDARPVPQKNTAYRQYFAIRKNDGTLITSWTAADTELSKDGGAFADATNEATEIGTSGVGYIDLIRHSSARHAPTRTGPPTPAKPHTARSPRPPRCRASPPCRRAVRGWKVFRS